METLLPCVRFYKCVIIARYYYVAETSDEMISNMFVFSLYGENGLCHKRHVRLHGEISEFSDIKTLGNSTCQKFVTKP